MASLREFCDKRKYLLDLERKDLSKCILEFENGAEFKQAAFNLKSIPQNFSKLFLFYYQLSPEESYVSF